MAAVRRVLALSVAPLALTLGACGGGGARPQPAPPPPPASTAPAPTPTPPPPAPTPPPPPPTTTAASFDDAEARRSNAVTSSGAVSAYIQNGTGRGIDIAVLDSGINASLADFAGKLHPASQDVGGQRGVTDTEGHGTAVSAVAAAARNGSGTMGVAFDARILSLNTSNPNDCTEDKGCKHSETAMAAALDIARQNGARIVNISLGGEAAGSRMIAALQRAAAAGMVVVISSGNDGAANPSGFASTLAQAGNGHVIIAGSVGTAPAAGATGADLTQVSTFSNRAGTSAAHYLSALGYRVTAPNENGELYLWSGTSFSAPVISGAAALLASAFPNLTGAQIVQLLLTTADDSGDAGSDAVFGRGTLNIARAFSPQGGIRAAGTSAIPLSGSGNGTTSTAMGDAEPAMKGVIVLDGFNRAYALDLAQTLSRAPAERPLVDALQPGLATASSVTGATSVSMTVRRNLTGPSEIELARTGLTREEAARARVVAGSAITRLTPQTAVAMGFSESANVLQQRLQNRGSGAFLVAREPGARSGLIASGTNSFGLRHDLGVAAVTVTGESGQVERATALTPGDDRRSAYNQVSVAADRRFGAANVTLGVTRMQERETVLGGRFGFAPDGATTTFLDAGLQYDFGRGWGADARVRAGWTQLPGGNGFVQGGLMTSDSWSLDLFRQSAFTAGDLVSLRVSQPLRVRSGGYDLRLPVAYDYADGGVTYEASTFSLAPRGREIDLEASYRVPLLRGAGSLSAHSFLRSQPGHVQAAGTDLGAAVRVSFGF